MLRFRILLQKVPTVFNSRTNRFCNFYVFFPVANVELKTWRHIPEDPKTFKSISAAVVSFNRSCFEFRLFGLDYTPMTVPCRVFSDLDLSPVRRSRVRLPGLVWRRGLVVWGVVIGFIAVIMGELLYRTNAEGLSDDEKCRSGLG